MCGIFGYFGTEKPANFLTERIRSLEYRGYDSAGIAYRNNSNNAKCFKGKGDIYSILKKDDINISQEHMSIGLAHTRWATHGNPSKRNAHPHEFNDFYLVHNGIIENYENLIHENKFTERTTDTDSEVIGRVFQRLLDDHPNEDLPKLVRKLCQSLKGSYACLIMFKDRPELIAMRYKSPLIIGIEKDTKNVLLSSDMHGFGDFKGDIYQISDKEFVITNNDGLQFLNSHEHTTPPFKYVELEAEQHSHEDCYFLKEIYAQPFLFSDEILKHHQQIVNDKLSKLNHPSTLQLIACGSAYHAALYGKILLDSLGKFHSEAFVASEFRYRKLPTQPHEWHMFVSQSGETADTLESARISNQNENISLFSITNHNINSLSRLTNNNLAMTCGTEISVAATKTFIAQLKMLTLFGMTMMDEPPPANPATFKSFFDTLPKLHESIKEKAQSASKIKTLVYLGKDLLLPIAMEGALKIKEIAYVHAEAFASGELKHGPLALIDESTCSIVLISKDFYPEKALIAVHEVKSRGGDVLIITDSEDILKQEPEKTIFLEHELPYIWCGVPFVVPLQMYAYEVAKQKGVNIDRPRNLAKSVTVE